jgi:hypothetical protein
MIAEQLLNREVREEVLGNWASAGHRTHFKPQKYAKRCRKTGHLRDIERLLNRKEREEREGVPERAGFAV